MDELLGLWKFVVCLDLQHFEKVHLSSTGSNLAFWINLHPTLLNTIQHIQYIDVHAENQRSKILADVADWNLDRECCPKSMEKMNEYFWAKNCPHFPTSGWKF